MFTSLSLHQIGLPSVGIPGDEANPLAISMQTDEHVCLQQQSLSIMAIALMVREMLSHSSDFVMCRHRRLQEVAQTLHVHKAL